MRSTILVFAAACTASPSIGSPCRSPFDCPPAAVCGDGTCRDPEQQAVQQIQSEFEALAEIDDEARPLRMRLRRIDLELQECRTDDCRAALTAERSELEPRLAEIEVRRDAANREFFGKLGP